MKIVSPNHLTQSPFHFGLLSMIISVAVFVANTDLGTCIRYLGKSVDVHCCSIRCHLSGMVCTCT